MFQIDMRAREICKTLDLRVIHRVIARVRAQLHLITHYESSIFNVSLFAKKTSSYGKLQDS